MHALSPQVSRYNNKTAKWEVISKVFRQENTLIQDHKIEKLLQRKYHGKPLLFSCNFVKNMSRI